MNIPQLIAKLEALPRYAVIEWINNTAWVRLGPAKYVKLDEYAKGGTK
jgi:hypothetical protein